ncbi:MAG TPA: aspartyl protease family protein, partial [Caulobacteraceae bacterium]|nr:aspartyl protease family protein [Caulobacteraceae bacterium]
MTLQPPMRALAPSLAVLALAAAAQAGPVAPTADAVLAANQKAMAGTPATGTLHLVYVWNGSGLTGTQTLETDLATGAFVDAQQAGGVGEGDGFDTRVPWMRDISGANTPEQGGDKQQLALDDAYRRSNRWWGRGRGGAAIAYIGRANREGRLADHLLVRPPGGKAFDAWFDADTHFLIETGEDAGFFHTRALYADWRPENGVPVAHRITNDPGQGPDTYEHLALQSAIVGPPRPLEAYACPPGSPTGGAIDGGAASVTLPFRLLNNHIYVQAKVDGQGPFTFIVDSGGHTLISPELVGRLGLKSVGQFQTSGAGEGHQASGFVEVPDIALGALHLRGQVGFATSVYDPSIEGIAVDGMVGFELIRRFATRIDYGARTITFTDPARFRPADAGDPVPFVFYDHLPQVRGFIADLPARLDIDTGSRSEIDITAPFVAAHDLRTRFTPGVTAVTGWGVGGKVTSYVARLPSLTLGDQTIARPVADIDSAKGGAFSDANVDGNIGGGVLQRFVVTLDYAHQVLWLKPLTQPPADAGTFDRAGMWINAGPDGFVVVDVTPGGPAAQGGVVVGDVITTLDNRPALPADLSAARILLHASPPGSKVTLQVRHAGDDREIV